MSWYNHVAKVRAKNRIKNQQYVENRCRKLIGLVKGWYSSNDEGIRIDLARRIMSLAEKNHMTSELYDVVYMVKKGTAKQIIEKLELVAYPKDNPQSIGALREEMKIRLYSLPDYIVEDLKLEMESAVRFDIENPDSYTNPDDIYDGLRCFTTLRQIAINIQQEKDYECFVDTLNTNDIDFFFMIISEIEADWAESLIQREIEKNR